MRSDSQLRARVTVTHGQRLRVRSAEGTELAAHRPRRDLQAVCGDWVHLQRDAPDDEWQLIAVEPRSDALYRSNARGGSEPIAANLTLLGVVVAPLPQPDWFVVDRYLSAASCAGIEALVVLNKCDLAVDSRLQTELQAELTAFAAAGYTVLEVSAQQGTGLQALQARLAAQTTLLVGQSGTGKSSLLRALIPECAAQTGALARDHTGRHTTTATRLYLLPQGGELLDSPGVRDFAPSVGRLDPQTLGFVELRELGTHCRFADCSHLREPQCAVRAAVGTALSARRYESYRRLWRLYQRLRATGTESLDSR